MIHRQSLVKLCRRQGSAKHHPKNCYYCWCKKLTDSRITVVKPEERLLAQIFGEGRFLQVNRKTEVNRRENARQLLTVDPSPVYWTDSNTTTF